MTRAEIIDFISNNPVFYLATVEEKMPHVRAMMLYKADEEGIFFTTGKNKDLYKQLTVNPNIEMCFYNPEKNVQIRISGEVEKIYDIEFKQEVVGKFQFLKPWVEQEGYDVITPFRVINCEAVVWTMETNFAPKEYIEL